MKQVKTVLSMFLVTAGLMSCQLIEKETSLDLWSEGASKVAITELVESVTDASSPYYVPPEERIAVFDNDGTLWSEQPLYFHIFSLSTASNNSRRSIPNGRPKSRLLLF